MGAAHPFPLIKAVGPGAALVGDQLDLGASGLPGQGARRYGRQAAKQFEKTFAARKNRLCKTYKNTGLYLVKLRNILQNKKKLLQFMTGRATMQITPMFRNVS